MTAVAAMASYPDRFYAAASYVGFGGSPTSAAKGVASKFSNDAALLLYALYQQVLASPNSVYSYSCFRMLQLLFS